ncbi:hypothetical protein KO465_09055 [Candidatus Micrarchaeota archaeon]|jgi:hypothetical protein|nr:hypothetical protein [Candidatus Micrarchaeota archaeon]
MKDRTITFNGQEYYQPTRQGFIVSDTIAKVWNNLGRPETPLSKSGEKLMNVIIATWEDTYPTQYREWIEARKEHLSAEKSINEQVKGKTGRNLASYPTYIYYLIKAIFPEFDFMKRDNQLKMVKKYPLFRFVNTI